MSINQSRQSQLNYLQLLLKSRFFLIFFLPLLIVGKLYAQVGINDDGSAPEISAGLDVDFSDKGFLPPRLTTEQRDAIVEPAAGLFIYNTEMNCLQFYNGSSWSGCLAEVQTNDFVCNSVNVSGNFMIGNPLTSSEIITIDVDVKVLETYSITTNIVNGYSFSVTGTFNSTGIQQVTLLGNGTPINAQTDNFSISMDGSSGSCQSDVVINYYEPSCLALLNNGYYDDGLYWIDPDGEGGVDPFNCYCDMTTNGGGWTMIAYDSDLPHANHFTPPDSWRWLDDDFSMSISDEQINALRNISTEGKQDLTITCQGVIVYGHASVGYVFSFGYRYHNGFETSYGQQTYPNTNITINTDGCMNNDAVVRSTTLSVFDKGVPVINFYSKDTGDTNESFGSPLTNEPAWLR